MWTVETKLAGPEPGDQPRSLAQGPEDWRVWLAPEYKPGAMRTHMLVQFASNAGVDTREKAEALVAKILAGLNAAD